MACCCGRDRVRARSNGTLDSGRKEVGSCCRVRLNLAVANRPRQAAVEIGAGRDARRVWCYVCRAAWSVWRREHRPQTLVRRRGGMGRTVRWARAVGEERDWMRRAGLRQCMDHDAVGGCGLSDEHEGCEGWSSAVLRRRRAGGERRVRAVVAVRWLCLARGGVAYHVCWRGRSGAETVCRLQRVVHGLCS